MKNILNTFLDWYFNKETTKTPLQRLIKSIIFLPFIFGCAILLIGACTYIALIFSIAALWTIIAALPYWIFTNTIAPKFIEKYFITPTKKLLN